MKTKFNSFIILLAISVSSYGGTQYISSVQLRSYGAGMVSLRASQTITFDDATGFVTAAILDNSSDQTLQYGLGRHAGFQKSSYILFSNGYVSRGQLKFTQDQYLQYGSLTGGLWFAAGKFTNFTSGFVSYGVTASNQDQIIYYRASQQVAIKRFSEVNFLNGYITSGKLNGTTQYLKISSSTSVVTNSSLIHAFVNGYFVVQPL